MSRIPRKRLGRGVTGVSLYRRKDTWEGLADTSRETR